MVEQSHRGRCYVVTGAASGIGAATAERLWHAGARVIGVDLRDSDVVADLATPAGRRAMFSVVSEFAPAGIDGILANAGGGEAETMLALNYFGAVATLEILRPLLQGSAAPRAVAVSSISALGPAVADIVAACLAGDESRALELGQSHLAQGGTGLDLYGTAKRALNDWCRDAASTDAWAGAGIVLNTVAFGVVQTPAAAWILDDPQARAGLERMAPLRGGVPGRAADAAALLAFCLSPENALMTGQVIYADAGIECQARGRRAA